MTFAFFKDIPWGWEARRALLMLAADESPAADRAAAERQYPGRAAFLRNRYRLAEEAFADLRAALTPLEEPLHFLFAPLPDTNLTPIDCLLGTSPAVLLGAFDRNALLAAHGVLFHNFAADVLDVEDDDPILEPVRGDLRALFRLLSAHGVGQTTLSAMLRVTTETEALLDTALAALHAAMVSLRTRETAFLADRAPFLAMTDDDAKQLLRTVKIVLPDTARINVYAASISPAHASLTLHQGVYTFILSPYVIEHVELAPDGEPLSAAYVQAALHMMTDKTKLDILRRLAQRSWYGAELAEALGLSGATVSHHMGQLLSQSLVRIESVGNRLYYHLCRELAKELIDQLAALLDVEGEP